MSAALQRGRLLAVLATGAFLSIGAASGRAAAPQPHLLVDAREIASSTGVERVITPPAKRPGPVVDGAHDHNWQPYTTILRERGVYRFWYSAKPTEDELRIGYTTSPDGIHLRRPFRLLPVPPGHQYGLTIIRDVRGGYLMPYFARSSHSGADEFKGFNFAHSSDGLRWTPFHREPQFQLGDVGLTRAPGDILKIIRYRGRYLLYVKMSAVGYEGMTQHMPFAGYRRIVGVMESRDGRRWTTPRPILAPDAGDAGITEFYGMGGIVQRGGLLVGFLRVLRDDLAADEGGPVQGIGYSVLTWSRDGRHWQRDRRPYLDRGGTGAWDHAMAWGDSQIVAGRRALIYYGGYRSGHKSDQRTGRQIGIATLPVDRYVARAAAARGRIVTRPVTLRSALTVNAAGSVRVTVKRNGRELASCPVAGTDATARPVPCARAIRGRVQLRFDLDRARLYAFSG